MPKRFLTIGETLIHLNVPLEWATNNQLTTYFGGDNFNVAYLLGRFDNKVHYFTILPEKNSLWTNKILHKLHEVKVGTNWISLQEGRLGTYYYQPTSALQQACVWYDRANSVYANVSEISPFKDEWLDQIDVLHFSGISLAPSITMQKHILAFVQKAHAKGIFISLDLNYRNKLWKSYLAFKNAIIPFLTYVDLCFGWLNEEDELIYCDFKEINENQLLALTEKFFQKYQIKYITSPIRTVINNNCHTVLSFVRFANKISLSKEFNFTPNHPIGAGDSYVATFLHSLHAKYSLNQIINFANYAYGLKHQFAGDLNYIHWEDLENFQLFSYNLNR